MKYYIIKRFLLLLIMIFVCSSMNDAKKYDLITDNTGFYIGDTKENSNRKIALKFTNNDSVSWILLKDRLDQNLNIVLITRAYHGYDISKYEKISNDIVYHNKDNSYFYFSQYRKVIIYNKTKDLKNIKITIINDEPNNYYIAKEIDMIFVKEYLIK